MNIKTIEIKKADVVSAFLSNLKHMFSPDWAICTTKSGVIAARHNTAQIGWTVVTGFYDGWGGLENDADTADWLLTDGFDWASIASMVEEEFKMNSSMVEDENGEYDFQNFRIDFI